MLTLGTINGLLVCVSHSSASINQDSIRFISFPNFVGSPRFDSVLHPIDILPSFFIHSTMDDGTNETITECVIIPMKAAILLRSLSP